MRPWYSFVIFFVMVSTVLGGIHYYLWKRLVLDPQLSPPIRSGLTVLLGGALALLLASFPMYRLIPFGFQGPLMATTMTWLGIMFLLLVLVAMADALRVGSLFLAGGAVQPGRRLFLSRLGAGVAGIAAAGTAVVSVRQALAALHVKEVPVALRRLPPGLNGFTLVQVTDIHVGPTIGHAFTSEMVRQINELRPDLVCVTGDLVDGSVADLAHGVSPLGDIQSKYGVFFVCGNHEYYSGRDAWLAHLKTLGVRPLMNERVSIGEGENRFDLAGVDDETGEPDMAAAAAGRDLERELIVMAHQPRTLKNVAPFGPGLVLSGHTHAGQIWPFNYLVALAQPYVGGLHRHAKTQTQIYVSPGTGYWGPPMRLGTQAEITKIVLSRETT